MIRVRAKRDAEGEHKVELYAHIDGEVRHASVVTRDADPAHSVARTFGLIGADKIADVSDEIPKETTP